MRARKAQLLIGFAATLFGAIAWAQQAPPQIGYVYPAGAQVDDTVLITLGGQRLEGVSGVQISGSGLKLDVLEYEKPLTQTQAGILRDELKMLLERRAAIEAARKGIPPATAPSTQPTTRPIWTPGDDARVAYIRSKLTAFQNRTQTPALAETVTVRVAVAIDAIAGEREIRLVTPNGLTNPMKFHIRQYNEVIEKEQKGADTKEENSITLPATINGRIMPGDIDRFRFKATAGQQLICIVQARALKPYIADAVPGWFQAVVTLRDSKGAELSYADDFRSNPDPVLRYVVPRDGEYVLEVKDALYRGREDFVYRIGVGDLPYVTSVYPPGVRKGQNTTLALSGFNLGAGRLVFDPRDKAVGVHSLTPTGARGLMANRVALPVDDLPESQEVEPNHERSIAQAVTLNRVINGRIDKPGDVDIYRFEGRAGQAVVLDLTARRIGSPLDSIVKLLDANGKQIAFNDDHADKSDGLNTHHADSYVSATLPATGSYFISVADVQNAGSADHTYRLRLSEPQPDFELRVVPSAINLRGSVPGVVTVHALRRDGFNGPIDIALRDAPEGFTLSGNRIPAGQDVIRMTVAAPQKAPFEPLTVRFEGKSQINDKTCSRIAVPADDLMQAFIYRHLVPAESQQICVLGRGWQRLPTLATRMPVRMAPGENITLAFSVPPTRDPSPPEPIFELVEPPDGVSIVKTVMENGFINTILAVDPAKAKPNAGNLILSFATQKQVPGVDGKPATMRKTSVGIVHAVSYEITRSKQP